MQIVEPIRTLDNIEKIKKVLKAKKDRNFLLFILGINCGLRVSDLLQLKISDIKNKTHIELVEQKTGKIRRFPLNPILTKLLNDYIKNKDENQWLFKSQKGVNQPITRIQAYRIIKKACERAGLNEHIDTHSLRKTFGYHYYQKYKDLSYLQYRFSQQTINETIRYIQISSPLPKYSARGVNL